MRDRAFFVLVKRKERLGLTFFGWLVLLFGVGGGFVFAVVEVHPFLALNRPVAGEILVVEGWLPDYALEEAVGEFGDKGYSLLVATGGPLAKGDYLIKYKNYAELTAVTLRESGLSEEKIRAVPAPSVKKDRTYASAVALREWLSATGLNVKGFNVISIGCHARRTWLLFKKAFDGADVEIGIIAEPNRDYDPERWWGSSAGVRSVIGESIAYFYARFLF